MKLDSLSEYTRIDKEKQALIDRAMIEAELRPKVFYSKGEMAPNLPDEASLADECPIDEDIPLLKQDIVNEYCLKEPSMDDIFTKVCPKCGRKYPKGELFCFDCAVSLKDIEDVNVRHIDVAHDFPFGAKDTYDDLTEILTPENLIRLTESDFSINDFRKITRNIKLTALKNLDSAVKEYELDLDSLSILEKVILFTKSFVNVNYKSYGQELGFYRFNTIFVDDRQLDALQITTMLHELTHFLIKEILTQTLCRILDASKTREMESIISFVLSYSAENCLIDEYAAHTVEGRFTLIGYQDYSSFLNIQKTIKRDADEIEMLKTIGNSLADVVKDIVESFLDEDLLDEIKSQFKKDIMDEPNYSQLMLENCTLLNEEGFIKAVEFILVDGFAVSMDNVEKLKEINEMW